MFLAVWLAVLFLLVTSLESGVLRSKRKFVPKSHVKELNQPPIANAAVSSPNRNLNIRTTAITHAQRTSSRRPQLNEFPLDAILFKGRETSKYL